MFVFSSHFFSFTLSLSCVCFCFCQMVMMTQQDCLGFLPHPPVKMWRHPHKCLMAAVNSAWPLVVRRKEALVCRTPASSVTSLSGINLSCFCFPKMLQVTSQCTDTHGVSLTIRHMPYLAVW